MEPEVHSVAGSAASSTAVAFTSGTRNLPLILPARETGISASESPPPPLPLEKKGKRKREKNKNCGIFPHAEMSAGGKGGGTELLVLSSSSDILPVRAHPVCVGTHIIYA